jgi:hypothetical protein
MKRTYVGIIQNQMCDMKTMVLAESIDAAKERVVAHCKGLGKVFREEEVQIIAFGA